MSQTLVTATREEKKRYSNDVGIATGILFGNLAFIGYNEATSRGLIRHTERFLGSAPRYYVMSGLVLGYGVGRFIFSKVCPPNTYRHE